MAESKRRVLILNDDPEIVELMVSVLSDSGYEVFSSLTHDLGEVVRTKPEIILLDCPPGEEKLVLNFAQRLRLTSAVKDVPILLGTPSLRFLEPALLRDKLILALLRPFSLDEMLQGIETLLNESDLRKKQT